MLFEDECEEYFLYSEDERSEFMFRLLRHFSTGGQWCQDDVVIEPYLNAMKYVYKDLLAWGNHNILLWIMIIYFSHILFELIQVLLVSVSKKFPAPEYKSRPRCTKLSLSILTTQFCFQKNAEISYHIISLI